MHIVISIVKDGVRVGCRNAEKALARGSEGAPAEGGEWARVAELCDFGPRRGRDVARLRSIVLQLKQASVRPAYPPRTAVSVYSSHHVTRTKMATIAHAVHAQSWQILPTYKMLSTKF